MKPRERACRGYGVVAGLMGSACIAGALSCTPATFICAHAKACGPSARCEALGFCSFPDEACESGYRYGAHSGAEYASRCVPASSGSTGPGDTSSDGGKAATSDAGPSGDGVDATEGAGASTSTSGGQDPAVTEDASTSTSTGDSEQHDVAMFEDDFERRDGSELGNGWIESNPSGFALASGGVVVAQGAGVDYRSNFVRRPAAEDFGDGYVGITVAASAAVHGTPQLFARSTRSRFDARSSHRTARSSALRKRATAMKAGSSSRGAAGSLNT